MALTRRMGGGSLALTRRTGGRGFALTRRTGGGVSANEAHAEPDLRLDRITRRTGSDKHSFCSCSSLFCLRGPEAVPRTYGPWPGGL